MRKTSIAIVVMASLVIWASRAMAADDAIAPFIDSKTDLVVHADAASIDLNAFLEFQKQMVAKGGVDAAAQAQMNSDAEKFMADIKGWQDDFKKAGGKDVYLVKSSEKDRTHQPGAMALLVPLGPGMDADAVSKSFLSRMNDNDTATAVVGQMMVVTSGEWLDVFKTPSTEARPDLLDALKAGPADAPIHIATTATGMPLPMLSGPGSPLADVSWVSLTLMLPPKGSARAVLKCKDADSAKAAAEKWNVVLTKLQSDPSTNEALAGKGAVLAKALAATVTDDKITVGLDQSVVEEIVPAMMKASSPPPPTTQPVAPPG